MVYTSIFMDKTHEPEEQDLTEKPGPASSLWSEIQHSVLEKYPAGKRYFQ